VFGYWKEIPAFKGFDPLKENAQALITLLMGVSYYLVTMLWLKQADTEKETRRMLRLVTYAGMVVLLKAFVEVVLWRAFGTWPDWYRSFHNLFSTGTLFRDRVVAFAFEPSWLSDMLNLLFIPYWLASAVTRTTMFKKKLWKFQVEDICLALGAVTLFLTLSRLGYLSFLLMIGVIILYASGWAVRRVEKLITKRQEHDQQAAAKKWLRVGLYFAIGLIYISMFLVAAFVISKLDHRSTELFDFSNFTFMRYAEMLSFGARVTYWGGGWNMFSQFPIIGVGLGNAGFYFPDMLPDYGWRLFEIRKLFFRQDVLLNVKSLWFRLLAETGIFGFAAFFSYLLGIFGMAFTLKRSRKSFPNFIGWMGLFALAAFLIEQMSLDTFALPYFWVTFGIIAAVYEQQEIGLSE
jgi:O-antigen ligase